MTNSVGNKHSVSFARGSRNYIRAIDLMQAAPISVSDKLFRFRFNDVIRHGGSWRRVTPQTDRQSIKAELFIQRSSSPEQWGFACQEQTALIAAPDVQISGPIEFLSRSVGAITVALGSDVEFWEQLVEAVRFSGDLLFPNRNWLIVGVSGSGACLLPLKDPATLTLELLNARNHLNVIRFVTSDGRDGRIMTTPRPNHAR